VTTPHAARRLRRWGFGGATGLSTWGDWADVRGDERLRIATLRRRRHHGLLRPVARGDTVGLTAQLR
jgi:hypothetical protein